MARVVVVGGGLGGTACAARLAKLGHQVTLLERSPSLGGALGTVEAEGFTWDAGPTHTLLPAVLRDLFRKSGRPLERELELVPLEVVREHRFADGSSVRLTGGSRAAQRAAFEALGSGLGEAWCAHVAAYSSTWDLLRRDYLERPFDPDLAPDALVALLRSRESLAGRVRRTLPDRRLREVALHPVVAAGHDPRRVPAWMGVEAYVEQRFGAWTVVGGMARLGRALTDRLATRRVEVLTSTEARDLVVRGGRVVAVDSTRGEVAADLVVCAVDPRRLPTLARHAVGRPAPLPHLTHLGVVAGEDDPGHEVVWGADPPVVLRPGGTAPAGAGAWTLLTRDLTRNRGRDPLDVLARRGTDVRDRVLVRVDRTPRELAGVWGGSPHGLLWRGRGTARRRLGPTTPVTGVYAAGACATPGAGIPFVGLGAALVAQSVGPA